MPLLAGGNVWIGQQVPGQFSWQIYEITDSKEMGQLTVARAGGALEGSTDLRSQAERVTYSLSSYSLLSSEHSDLFYFISVGFLNISSHSPLTWQKSKNPFFKLCITTFSGFCTFQESPL